MTCRTLYDRIGPFRSLASGLTRIGRHTRALAGSDVAKHHHHCTAIERTGLFQTVVLLELHEGLLGLRTDHTIKGAAVKTCVPQLQLCLPDNLATTCGC